MSVFDWILYIFIAICALLFMIMIHEFGHYTAGKLLRFKINEFSIGFGKAIFSKKKANGEVFSLRMIPLGGFCAFEGEDEEKPDCPGAFNSMPVWKRLIVLFSGAFFNFLSAILFSIIFLMAFGYADRVQIDNVTLPAGVVSENWLQKGDIVLAVDGKYTNLVYDEYFGNMIAKYDAGEEFTVKVKRDGKELDIVVSKQVLSKLPSMTDNGTTLWSLDNLSYSYKIVVEGDTKKVCEVDSKGNVVKEYVADASGNVVVNNRTFTLVEEEDGKFSLQGAVIGVTTNFYKYGFFEALGQAFIFCCQWAWKILIILWHLITGQLAITSLGGTVTTIVTMAEATKANFANLLLLVPLISVNLAVFNLLPIPALDGARMIFVGIEGIRRKPISRKVEGMIHFVGLIVLFAFVVLVDILHFVL